MINMIPVGSAQVSVFGPDDKDDCEVCFCRDAVGTFNLAGVEVALCRSCATYRTGDGKEVVIYNG